MLGRYIRRHATKRRVQVNKVSYDPNLFKLLFIEPSSPTHPTEKDESDDIEKDKHLPPTSCDYYGKPRYINPFIVKDTKEKSWGKETIFME